jgi:acyl transferase domain-containing protein
LKDSLAIVGMACRLPGADGLDAFWRLVAEGRTAWGPLPESRFSRDLYFHPEKSRVGKSYSEMGAVVSDRPVDPTVCPITPAMLSQYDVAHHIFLEVASLACRDAGMDPFAMPADRRTGVYVGHTGGSTKIGDLVYSTGIDEAAALLSEVDAARALLGEDVDAVSAEVTAAVRKRYPGRKPGENLDLGAIGAAKIVQEALQLDGPYLVVDAACASSLQAMAIGARALLQGGIDQAIVGGASYCKSDSLVLFSAAQSVSNVGSCPFGEAADGLITAEGYVALVIKTLSRAIADGDRIRAVIRGLGVASDGKGKSLWAPRQEGQVLAVERAYPDATDIGRIEYIEAHATSTQVGDATELGALSRLMAKHLPAGRQIPIGSVKANIGHTLETAGIASLVKVVLAMEHGAIPPGSTCDELNGEFDWKNGPFTVPKAPLAWPAHVDGSPRCAAVNAFGIGGLNVHVSLAEHVRATRHAAPTAASAADDDAIAIVGAGCVLPGALTLEAFFDRLERGETAIGPVPSDRWLAGRALDASGPRTWHAMADQGGFVRDFNYDWRRHKVPPKQIAAANPLQFMLLEAADAAIADAGGPQAGLERTRTGVVVGTLFGGEFANQLQMGLRLPETGRFLRDALARRGVAAAEIDRIVDAYEKKVLERLPALVDETGSFTSSTLASRLTKTFDLMGGALALDSGDCSSLSALSAAVDMLRERACDAVICAAGDRSMDLMAYEGRSLGRLLSKAPVSVLDGRTSGGAVPGEGAVVLVLKRLADARAAGNTIRGVIRGVAVGSGRSVSEAARRVVREACERAVIDPAAVGAVEVAISAGHANSGEELVALGGHYAGSDAAGETAVAGSLDGLIGHVGAAAGAAGLLKLSRALAAGALPGTAALSADRAQVHGLVAARSSMPVRPVDAAGCRVGTVTVAQDRQVAHAVIDNGLAVPEAARPRPVGLATVRGPSPQRAACSHAVGRPLVAAIFPGQGSQYTDMFRGLVDESSDARAVLGQLDSMARAAGRETLAEIAWRPDNGLGTRIWDTQWAMYLGDLLAWGVLQDMGFKPDVVASHSFGEFPSLAAVGAWSVEDGARATKARADAVERHGPRNGAMLSVIADRATVQSAIEPFTGQVWVCAENAPEQAVIGGTARIVDAVEVILESRRVKSKRLAVPSPFHTPLLAAASDELAATIRSLPIATPRITTYSSTTTELLTRSADIHDSLIRQMTETVRWVSVVEKLYEAGVRTFVEVGPSGVLTGLTRRILEGREGVTFLQFDQRGRSPREHLARLGEQLAAAGALGGGASQERVATPSQPRQLGRIVSFDATTRRRERNRSGGAAPRGATRPVEMAAHEEVGRNSNGRVHREPAAPQPAAVATQVLEPVAEPTSRLAALVQEQPATGTEAFYLEDAIAELLTEAGIEPPLMRAGGASRGVQTFLDSATHLFEITADDHSAILSAASRDALCDVLARSGGKSRWLSRKPAKEGPAAAELEAFLIDFVVEQTGYPREIVELDADLEADLGIDSIRKAQLFGEIGQKYGLTADDSVSLDEFPTLRHLLGYMLPRVGGKSAPRWAAPAKTIVDRGEYFDRGLRSGREHAVVIRLWARQIAAGGVATRPTGLDPALDEELTGIAEGAGVDADIIAAAFADPAAALGGCDAMIVAPVETAADARGLLVCFGRHAEPAARCFEANGLRGTLVGVRGLPGAVVGWNQAGLVATISRGNATHAPVACIVERVVTECRSIAEADAMIARMATRPCGLVVASVRGGGIEVSPAGKIESVPTVFRQCDSRAALARVALADGATVPEQALASVLMASGGMGESLSATCVWMAVGSASGKPAVRAGGPAGRDWLAGAAVQPVGEVWLTVSREAPKAAATGIPKANEITRRYGLAVRDAGSTHAARSLGGERVLILGSGNLADAMVAALRAQGASPLVVDCGSVEEASAAVERAEAGGPVRHIVVATPRQSAAGDWIPRRSAAVITPFFACQRWLVLRGKANDIGSATLTAVANLGGDFGVAGAIGSVESGAMAGLFKGIAREFSQLHVRVVDAPAALTAVELAKGIVSEMQDGDGPVEIGLVDGRRVTIAACETRPAASAALESLKPGSTWIVTGGARGVTAECARELGRRNGLKLVLVGSTALIAVEQSWLSLEDAGLRDLKGRVMLDAKGRGADPRTAWKTVEKSIEIAKSLAKFSAAGVDARYFPCNLSDAAAVRSLVQSITRDVGPVRGIVHGAGFEAACRFEKKTVDGLEATLGPKCVGLEHLLAAIDATTLEAVIGFGSTSGRLGGHGQADYSLANDMLAKMLVQLRQRRGLRATVFHWHAWDEVGMASRPESRFVLEQFGLKFMPLAEGVRRFMDEIEAGLPEAEVLVTEPAMCPDAVSSAVAPCDSVAATTALTHTASALTNGRVPEPAGDVGSLVGGVEQQGNSTWVSFRLDPASDRFLIDHLQHGRPLLPAVMGAELLAQAAVAAGQCGRVQEIRDFAVERPIGFPVDALRDVRVEIGARDGDTIVAQGWAPVLNAEGRTAGEERVHLRGKVLAGAAEPVVATLDQPPFPFNPMVYQDDAALRHGSTFRTLTGLFLDRSGGWGRLVAPAADVVAQPRGALGWTVPVALLDGCIVACAVYSYILCGRRAEVPVAFERLRIMSPPRSGEKCTVRLFFQSQDQRESVYDFVLFGDDGRAILALDGLHLVVAGPDRSRHP